ncbi:MAG: tetratricopeptide repeat protein [Alphaproteobacteria bacterium]|jgi:predicted Zn-dependent protease|nr:tetratricopeptide repeat protein [Alphaproteobacteria bacterium]
MTIRVLRPGLAAALVLAMTASGALAMGSGTREPEPEPAPQAAPAPETAPDAAMPDSGGEWAGYNRAVELIEDGRYQDGIDILESVVAENPNDADAWNYLGYANRQLGRYDRALSHYDRALSLDPDHLAALEYLGEAHLALNDLAAAQEQLARLGELCPSGCAEQLELARAIAAYRATN